MAIIRAFLAIDIDAALRESATEIAETLKTQHPNIPLRWSKPENLHLTLRFFAELKEELIPQLTANLEQAVATIKPFEIPITKVQYFPPNKNPRIIAILFRLNEALAELVYAAERSVTALDFKTEQRPYVPHLTLCRSRDQKLPDINDLSITLPGTLAVDHLTLYKSQPGPQGSLYTSLQTINLS